MIGGSSKTFNRNDMKKLFLSVLGTLFFAVGMNLFVVSAGLYSGGFLGIGQLIRTFLVEIFGLPLSGIDIAGIVFYMINIPIFVIAWRDMERRFFIYTIICVTAQTVFLTFIPTNIRILGNEPFVAAVIGGAIAGYGVGLTLQEGGSGGGQDVLGLYIMGRNSKFSVGKMALCINLVVYLICAFMYDLKTVIYSVVYVMVSSYVTDRVHAQNVNEKAVIITPEKKAVLSLIREKNRTATIMKGIGGYKNEDTHIIITALSRYEARSVENQIREKGIQAFIIFSDVNRIYGNYEKHLES